MKSKIIIAVVSVGFLSWLWQILTPVHPKDPRLGFVVRTWDGQIVMHSRTPTER